MCKETGRPVTSDRQWEEQHVFDHMQIFNGALKRFVREKFDRLTSDQKNAVNGYAFALAQSERRFQDIFSYNPYMAEHDAKENILRLINAINMELPGMFGLDFSPSRIGLEVRW